MADEALLDAAALSLLSAGVVTMRFDEPVTFKSGIKAPVYLDNRRLPFHPAAWQTVMGALRAKLETDAPNADVIAGIEAAGIPHGAALAYMIHRPFVFVRKEAKGHGLGQRIEGGEVSGRRVLLIEDQITTGGSSLSGVEALREAGALVNGCAAITSYGFAEAEAAFKQAGVRLHVLLPFARIAAAAQAHGRISADELAVIEDWLADPRAWRSGEGSG